MTIIAWLVIGLIAGLLARLIVPGRDPMGLLATLVLGLVTPDRSPGHNRRVAPVITARTKVIR